MRGKHAFRAASVAAAALLLALAAGGTTSSARADEGTTPYTDVAGDSGGAPDILGVTVTDSGGVVTLAVHATGLQPAEPADTTWVDAGIDADRDTATGDEEGIDYVLEFGTAAEPFHGFWQWTGEWTEMTASPQMSFTAGEDVYTFTLGAADLGGTSSFDFYVSSGLVAGETPVEGAYDVAPDGADWWTYSLTGVAPAGQPAPGDPYRPLAGLIGGGAYLLADGEWHLIDPAAFTASGFTNDAAVWFGSLPGTIGAPATSEQVAAAAASWKELMSTIAQPVPPATEPAPPVAAGPPPVVKPVIARPVTTPKRAVAGKTFTVRFPVTRSDTGVKLTTGTLICDPSVGKKVIRHAEQFRDGTAMLRFTVPATAKGKLLKVHVTIRLGDQSSTRVSSFRVG